jgi:type IV pilus assembly protein PilE
MNLDLAAKGVQARRRGSAGVTLIELLVALVLVGVVAAIAIPSYSSYVARGQRSAAKAALLQSAQFLERNYTTFGCYNQTSATCGTASAVALTTPAAQYAPTDGAPAYTYALTFASQSASTYTLQATPCGETSCPTGSNQTFDDTDCGVLTLSNTGAKGASGNIGSGNPAACWNR